MSVDELIVSLWETIKKEVRPPATPSYRRFQAAVIPLLRDYGQAIRAASGKTTPHPGFHVEKEAARNIFTVPLDWGRFAPKVREILSQYQLRIESEGDAKHMRFAHRVSVTPEPHPEDFVVDRFAELMKWKLARERERGRGDWREVGPEPLVDLLHDAVRRGDLLSVATAAAMLHDLGYERAEMQERNDARSRIRLKI